MSALSGLTTHEAQKRLHQFGANSLPQSPPASDVEIFLRQLTSPLIYVLIAACVVSFILSDEVDALVILLAVLVNSLLGFYQERKAERSLAALKKIIHPQAKVIRDGKQQQITVNDLVPGDVIILTSGDIVPADAVVLTSSQFLVNEAVLTGESVAVTKHPSHKVLNENGISEIVPSSYVFMGTKVVSGISTVKIIKTGIHTKLGEIAQTLSHEQEEPTPLQIRLGNLARWLSVAVIFSAALIFIIGVMSGKNATVMFSTAVAVAVAAIPEGMMISLTVILAIGMQQMFRRNALVRKMVATETLGAVTVIATDKTGTLTEGKLRVTHEVTHNKKLLIQAAIFGNNLLDPLEIALWEWAQHEGFDPQKLRDERPPLTILPFDTQHKFSATIYENEAIILGAPEVIIEKSKTTEEQKADYVNKLKTLGSQGFRLIGVAHIAGGQAEHNSHKKLTQWDFLGLVAFEDPVRTSVTESLAQARTAGIRACVITGDYRFTAEAVLNKLGILITQPEKQILEGDELEHLTEEELKRRISDIVLFARVSPQQKHTIVSALKSEGEIVALVGDGVNDALALKKADIGIVVGDASDVARETADMVLIDSNFGTILAAIEEGRNVYLSIRRIILYLLSTSLSEMFIILGAIFFDIPLPLSASGILFINIITDGFPNLALTFEKKQKNLLLQPPISSQAALLGGSLLLSMLLISFSMAIFCLLLFFVVRLMTSNVLFAQTAVFTALSLSTIFSAFSLRDIYEPIWKFGFLSNKSLVIACGMSIVILLSVIYLPFFQPALNTTNIGISIWLPIVCVVLVNIMFIELIKRFMLSLDRE